MILAAIDIGSNAIRLQVIRVIKEGERISFKKLEFIRFPLRLGRDVFTSGAIQAATAQKFEKLMRTFKDLIDLYEVHAYIARATSAMREAENGQELVKKVLTQYGLKIRIISGKEEADLLNKAIRPYLDDKCYVHIDVGGGSTELNIYVGKKLVSSKSFKMGSVRQLSGRQRKTVFNKIAEWRKKDCPTLQAPVIAVGTGGNINKLFQLANQRYQHSISLAELQALRAYVAEFSYEQRLAILKMNPDRADVIVPASEIYSEVMQLFGADYIMVPGVGLKDGLLYTLYEAVSHERIEDIQFLGQF
ncbi:MAG: phosphatase [Lewinellaceae bacterium]|nr:phosphatase [Lewinellaceae bacterium]